MMSKIKESIQLVMLVLALSTATITGIGWTYLQYSRWADVPEQVERLSEEFATFNTILGSQVPEIVNFRGNGVTHLEEVRAGDSIGISYVLRRNVSCDTIIRVRFFDHDTGRINNTYSYEIPAVKSPVSLDYSPFTTPVYIPRELPEGTYSYLPEIIPVDCGVYKTVVPPMSESFKVLPNEPDP